MSDSEVTVPQGLLLVDKPSGWTSFDVVAKVRSLIARDIGVKPKRVKVGHSGTLDPLATGLLLLAVGKSTKQLPGLIKKDKVYQVGAIFGVTSETGDAEGELTILKDIKPPSKIELEAVLSRFEGQMEQIPPKYSAIKINGQRAYKLAREGKEVVIEPRQVTINSISNVSYDWPELKFTCDVSSGTYIRTLVEDIGNELKVGAYMADLHRVTIDTYSIENAISLNKETSAKDIYNNLIQIET